MKKNYKWTFFSIEIETLIRQIDEPLTSSLAWIQQVKSKFYQRSTSIKTNSIETTQWMLENSQNR